MNENSLAPSSDVAKRQGLQDSEAVQDHAVVPYDVSLLERALTQWQFGDWESLSRLDRDQLQHHPDRARLALLVAAGHFQNGSVLHARQFARMARDWGCSDKRMAQILISGVYNSLARQAAVQGDSSKSSQFFETALAVGAPTGETTLLTQARMGYQLAVLGVRPGQYGRLQIINATGAVSAPSGQTVADENAPALRSASTASYAFYQRLNAESRAGIPTPFLLLDSKSIPRSGLHYLKTRLARILGEQFSFCEWYQEPGCCKKTPCALTGYAMHARNSGQFRLRLTKSHDLDLTDPIYDPTHNLRHLILVRHPLYVLTSWFMLDQFHRQQDDLLRSGIKMQKIWLGHEKEVLASAYSILDEHFQPPSIDQLASWLTVKSNYIAGFMNKWVVPLTSQRQPGYYLVQYEGIDRFIEQILREYAEFLSEEARAYLNTTDASNRGSFTGRADPFALPVASISRYVSCNSGMFLDVAERIRKLDKSGYLAQSYSG